MKRLIIDLDGTLTNLDSDDYLKVSPKKKVIEKLKEYKSAGFEIVISTSRNMRTYDKNIGLINIHTLPSILSWLNFHEIPYDEVLVGKPWCGTDGFYVDDKSIRPSEFAKYDYEEIKDLLNKEN